MLGILEWQLHDIFVAQMYRLRFAEISSSLLQFVYRKERYVEAVQCNLLFQILFPKHVSTLYLSKQTTNISVGSSKRMLYVFIGSRYSVVGIATGYGLDDRRAGVRVPLESRIFSPQRRPDQSWGPPSLVKNGYRRMFPRE
jgi:hypothetical protein